MNIITTLNKAVKLFPDQEAVVDGDIRLTYRQVGERVDRLAAGLSELGRNHQDCISVVTPMFHLADAWATFALTWVGGEHVMLPEFDAARAIALIEEEKITISNLIPTMLNMMVNHPEGGNHDYASLRIILSGGAPIAPETVRRIVETFDCGYVQTYGLTETSPYVTVSILKNHLSTGCCPNPLLVVLFRYNGMIAFLTY